MSPLKHRQLAGYSGASLFLMSHSTGGYFVRKQASAAIYNDRLRRQMKKQSFVYGLPRRPFGIPRVDDSGLEGELFYYDMEFIDGMDAPTVLATVGLAEVRSISCQLEETLRFFANQPPFDTETGDFFNALTRRVLAVTRLDIGLSHADAVKLLEGLDDLARSESFGPTLCHGDLSLENMIISRSGELLLVDLLDSPLAHYWQDVAKMFLDLNGQWYARRYPRISEWTLAALRESILGYMSESAPNYLKYHNVLVAVNFVRILPYAANEADRALLLRSVRRTLHADFCM